MANVLNFSSDNLITGVNVIDGNLYWTDDLNEPKKLEIDRFKQDDIGLNSGATTIDGRLMDYTDITVIRPHPSKVIDLSLVDYDDTEFDTQRVSSPEPPFESIFPRFSYRWRYEDGQYSPYAPFTQAAFMSKEREFLDYPDWLNRNSYRSGDNVNYEGRAYVSTRSIAAPATDAEPNEEPSVSNTAWTDIGEAVNPTTEVNYREGFNTTMFNNVGRITLNNISRGTEDVIEIDILYTESISDTIYVLETLAIPPEQRGMDFTLTQAYLNRVQESGSGIPTASDYSLQPLSYTLSTRKIYNALPANQLTRPFDNVPRLAKSQEITANRLVYGNYLHQYNQPSGVNLNVEAIPAEMFPGITDTDTVEHLSAQSATDGLHVKGNRTYEVGVAYIDSFGRQGAMIQNVSSFNDDGTLNEAAAFRTSFHQPTREALQVTLNSEPPSWADSYRYFIKDVSQNYHSLICYNIYNDGGAEEGASTYIWAEFSSTDRNKVTDETILVPRRINNQILEVKNRHLVQDIQGEAPELIRAQLGLDGNTTGALLGGRNHNRANINRDLRRDEDDNFFVRVGSNAPPTTLILRDERQDFSETGVTQILNRFLGTNDIPIIQDGGQVPSFEVVRNTNSNLPIQTADLDSVDSESQLYMRFVHDGDSTRMPITNWTRVTDITFQSDSDRSNSHRTNLTFNVAESVTIQGTTGAPATAVGIESVTDGSDIAMGFNQVDSDGSNSGTDFRALPTNANGGRGGNNWRVEWASSSLSEEALERLQGRFWVKIPRTGLDTARSEFSNEGNLTSLHQVWFETEPTVSESQLDLFWETSDTFCVCTDHGWPNKLNWYNTAAESTADGVYLETTRINDKFNSVQLMKGVRVNVPQERYAQERRLYGLTWSGIYNSRTGINRLNEFITADGITKELEPNYGSLQKLHTRDTNLIAMCEDKFFRILADKDQLFNADGGGNVSATNAVLGQTTPFVGEYGISTHPESFASYGHNFWCTDAKRGVTIQITPGNGQIFETSGNGLDDFFRDRLFSADRLVGMYDDYTDAYTLSIQGYNQEDAIIAPVDRLPDETSNTTVKYETSVEGWPAFLDFIPESGLTLNNKFYTWKGGKLYMHNSNTSNRNNFYGTQYNSEIEIIFNDAPSSVKEFLALNYEGTSGWEMASIETDQDTANLLGDWLSREGKYHQAITSTEPVYVYDATQENNARATEETRIKSGAKGFYAKVTMRNTRTDAAELFAVSSEVFESSL